MAFRWMDLSDWLSYRYSIIVKSQVVGSCYCCKARETSSIGRKHAITCCYISG